MKYIPTFEQFINESINIKESIDIDEMIYDLREIVRDGDIPLFKKVARTIMDNEDVKELDWSDEDEIIDVLVDEINDLEDNEIKSLYKKFERYL